MRRSEVNHGDSFSCRIQGRAVTGKINKEYDSTRILLCNNIKTGAVRPHELFGKDGCWAVSVVGGNLAFEPANVTDFRITKTSKQKSLTALKKGAQQYQQALAPVKPPTETPEERVARIERELSEARAQVQAKKAAEPGKFRNWNIFREGNTYTFGCGEVRLTKEQLQSWLTVQKHLNRRGLLSTSLVDGDRINPRVCTKDHVIDTMNHALEVAERIVKLK